MIHVIDANLKNRKKYIKYIKIYKKNLSYTCEILSWKINLCQYFYIYYICKSIRDLHIGKIYGLKEEFLILKYY